MSEQILAAFISAASAIIAALIPIIYEIIKRKQKKKLLSEDVQIRKNKKLPKKIILIWGIVGLLLGGGIGIPVASLLVGSKETKTKGSVSIPDTTTTATSSHTTSDTVALSHREKTYDVTLVLPASMSDATILVDGKQALILERTSLVVKIRVAEKNTNHEITVQKGDAYCTSKEFIRQNNKRIILCF